MIYPNYISKGKLIGVAAPSDGIRSDEKLYRLDKAKENLEKLGYKVIETKSVRHSNLGVSASAKDRADELHSLYLNKDVELISCATGGEFLMEILPYIDSEIIKNNVKWIAGYSDPTMLLYMITTMFDIATIYTNNFCSYGMKNWHESIENNIKLLSGQNIIQYSFDKSQDGYTNYVIGDEEYNLNKEVCWKNLFGEKNINITGRIIGGCLDCFDFILGSPFDNGVGFIEKYKGDGIIWFFDNYELTCEEVIRTLFKFKVMGYFNYTRGIIFGRSAVNNSYYGIDFKDALKYSLKDLNIPVIYDVDIGHVCPQMTIINGAIASICSENGKGKISFELK